MTTYRIESSAGVEMGTFEAESAAGALDAMAREAGYRDQAHAAEAAGAFEGKVVEVPALAVTDVTASPDGRVIEVHYTRTPRDYESLDAREWDGVKSRVRAMAQEQIAKNGRDVEVYATAPDSQGWMIDQISPE